MKFSGLWDDASVPLALFPRSYLIGQLAIISHRVPILGRISGKAIPPASLYVYAVVFSWGPCPSSNLLEQAEKVLLLTTWHEP